MQNSLKTPHNPSKRYSLCQKDATFTFSESNSFNFDQIYKKNTNNTIWITFIILIVKYVYFYILK